MYDPHWLNTDKQNIIHSYRDTIATGSCLVLMAEVQIVYCL